VLGADSEPVLTTRPQHPKPSVTVPLLRRPVAPRSVGRATGDLSLDEAKISALASGAEPRTEEAKGPSIAFQPKSDVGPSAVPRTATEPRPASAETGDQKLALAGNWFFVPVFGQEADAGSYSAQYIEFILAEEKGSLVGSFRAKYKVPDRAVASEISFRAQGRLQDGQSARLVWISADGAKGEIDLSLQSPNLMRMMWWTSEFGARPALASGEALLVRQRQTR